jgi:hypothetical protein
MTGAEQIAYLEARAARGRNVKLADILARAGTTGAVLPGDELPEEWLEPPAPPA